MYNKLIDECCCVLLCDTMWIRVCVCVNIYIYILQPTYSPVAWDFSGAFWSSWFIDITSYFCNYSWFIDNKLLVFFTTAPQSWQFLLLYPLNTIPLLSKPSTLHFYPSFSRATPPTSSL